MVVSIPGTSKVPRSVLLPPSFVAGSPSKAVQRRRQLQDEVDALAKRSAQSPIAGSPAAKAKPQRMSPLRDSRAADAPDVNTRRTGDIPLLPQRETPKPQQGTDSAARTPQGAGLNRTVQVQSLDETKSLGATQQQHRRTTPSSQSLFVGGGAKNRTSAAEALLQHRSKVAVLRDDATIEEGMDEEALAEVERRAARDCELLRQYVAELHYAVYSYFLGASQDAYIEVPAALRCCVTPAVMNLMLHKLHGSVRQRQDYLQSVTVPGLEISVTRANLIRSLHAGALFEFMPPAWPEGETELHGDCIVIPRFEGRFIVLKGEDSAAADDHELDAFIERPSGVVYDAARRHHLYAVLSELEGAKVVEERLRRAEEASAQREAMELQLRAAEASGAATPYRDAGTSSPGESDVMMTRSRSMVQASTPARVDTFCVRCHTCTMCCVCSLIGRKPLYE
jgi:hypothetical protein